MILRLIAAVSLIWASALIVGDELRAIKRYLATRTDQLPWLFLSEPRPLAIGLPQPAFCAARLRTVRSRRGQPLTRSSVQYLVRVAGGSMGWGLPPPPCARGVNGSTCMRLLCRRRPESVVLLQSLPQNGDAAGR